MTIKIFGRKSSCNVQKVIWLCSELKIDFETKDYGGKYGRTKEEAYKALNPNSTVPLIEDEGFFLYESNAIIKYLSNKYNYLKLEDHKMIAKRDQWMDWAGFTLAAPCAIITLNLILLPPEKRDASKVSKAKEQVLSLLKILNNQLGDNQYLLGQEFSLADIPAGCWYNRCLKLDFDLSSFKGISAWGARLSKRKAFQNSIINAPMPPN
tara:strand:+ start:79 stop:705 length:627 start_codon:yes stop_codon:yes gene_type:complete